ncbi:hypothetical protein J9978_04830 [Chromobacterium violaceum]|nr:hypothetical protein [Chromobacterium violaceum]MBP4048820.1 hypothetical protein [Chromobacterium violaceum]
MAQELGGFIGRLDHARYGNGTKDESLNMPFAFYLRRLVNLRLLQSTMFL